MHETQHSTGSSTPSDAQDLASGLGNPGVSGPASQAGHDPSGQAPSGSRSEAQLRLLIDTGLSMASERNLDVIVQTALDAGLTISGAQFGAFFYNNRGDDGEPYPLYKVSGLNAEAFRSFPLPRPTTLFDVTFQGKGTVRSADITQDPRYGDNAPVFGMPAGHPPVCSYLAVPVKNRAGEVLGGLLYGHMEKDAFAAESEDLVATMASQAATAIDNVRLADDLSREIVLTDAAQKLQRQTAHRLRQALEAGQLGTWTWDRSTDLLDMDDRAADLFQTPRNMPVARSTLRQRMVLTQDRSITLDSLRQSLENGGLYNAEYRLENGAGAEKWVASSGIATYRPGSTEVTGMIGTVQDVTARKSHEATLRESEKLAATGRLAATIAHEINNPLEAVTNLIYLCKTDPEVPKDAQRLLETADSELARVAQIAQQTLGFYRDTTRPVAINLSQLLHSIVELFARKMTSHRIACTLDIAPHLMIFGLQGEIRQVFSNLLVNAIDAATGGSIHIRARCHARRDGTSRTTVLIADDGTGIPVEVRARLFSPFFTTKQAVGTGLGLWVTRGIVEKQGGSIQFRSRTGTPSGTLFRVALRAGAKAEAQVA